jgi:hypothetical protein
MHNMKPFLRSERYVTLGLPLAEDTHVDLAPSSYLYRKRSGRLQGHVAS